MADPDAERERRVVLLAPTAQNAAPSPRILAPAGVSRPPSPGLKTVCRELEAGAGAAVLTEQALAAVDVKELAELLMRQPAWSDFPLLILTRGESTPPAVQALQELGNVMLLELPVRFRTLVSAV